MAKQGLPWKPKKRFPWKLLLGMIAVIGVAVGLAGLVTTFGTGGNLQAALSAGRLADLPDSATNVEVAGTGSSQSVTYLLKFTATVEDIEHFIAESPSIRWREPEQLGPERMYVPRTEGGDAGPHVYFQPDSRYPWFDPTVREQGRRYVIPPERGSGSGEVIVDDGNHIVYISVSRSR